MSEHPTQRQLVLHVTGDAERPDAVEAHLGACERCRREGEQIRRLLELTRAVTVPEPDAELEARIWRRVRADLDADLLRELPSGDPAPRPVDRLRAWLSPRRLALAASIAALVAIAFLAGLLLPPPDGSPLAPSTAGDGDVRERVLLVSVGDHLARSRRVLVELVNAEADGSLDLRAQRRTARDLLVDNRLYRQSARIGEQRLVAELLEDLERLLLEVAHGPEELPAEELEWIRERIASRDLLFRVRVVEENVRKQETRPAVGSVG